MMHLFLMPLHNKLQGAPTLSTLNTKVTTQTGKKHVVYLNAKAD
jgi:hypothetical protein